MKEIRNFKELKEKVIFGELPYNVMKDVIMQIYIFSSEFDPTQSYSQNNKVVLLDSNEIYENINQCCELEEIIAGYKKQVFIQSDYGESIVVYKKLTTT